MCENESTKSTRLSESGGAYGSIVPTTTFPNLTICTELRLAIVTNIPAPYRVPVYNRLATQLNGALHVFYAIEREPDRNWDLPEFRHEHTFLQGRMYTRRGRFIHDNPEVYERLKAFKPNVVITTGFNPTHLYAFAYTMFHKCKHVAMTDGTELSESELSKFHRKVRRFVFARSQAFVVASDGGRRLLRGYGLADEGIYFSPLCANTSVDWDNTAPVEPELDLLFSGRLVAAKNPAFFLEVASGVAARIGRRVSVGILGSGPLEQQLRTQAALIQDQVVVHFAGHVAQVEIPKWFKGARVFLFPTAWDVWGVVANEACLAGIPVVVSPFAGVGGELVVDGVSGFVRSLNVAQWVEATSAILQSPELHARMSLAARKSVARYSFENAAKGIVDAARAAIMPRILCIQRRLTHYRAPLFESLRRRLAADGLQFDLAFGDPAPSERTKQDEGKLSWATHIPCHYLLRERLCWQNPGRLATGVELMIVTQENKLLFNLLATTTRRPRRLAFWGHGRNFQSVNSSGIAEHFKRLMLKRVDWWFAYTGLSGHLVTQAGFSPERVTNLENAIDTQDLVRMCDAVTDDDIRGFREHWRVGLGPVGVFIGSLYQEKRIEFLLEAGERFAKKIADFHMVIVGSGPQREIVERAAGRHDWLRYCGVQFGMSKAICLRSADVMLSPGALGVGILDSFASGLPLITTDHGTHGPEIDYLRSGENGVMTADSLEAFVSASEELLFDSDLRHRLGAAARKDAEHYTLDNMVENFRRGILAALETRSR